MFMSFHCGFQGNSQICFARMDSPSRSRRSSCQDSTITFWQTTLAITPLDEWSARCRDPYLTTQHSQETDFHAPCGVRTHNPSTRDKQHSLLLLWTSDRLVAEIPTWQHTTFRRNRLPCPLQGSNPQSQQAWQTTFAITPLDEWSARCRDLYLTTHNIHKKQISMPSAGFEPTIPASERPQTGTLDHAATGIGHFTKMFRAKNFCGVPHSLQH